MTGGLKQITGSEKQWNADIMLLAMGFSVAEDDIPNELGLEIEKDGNVKADYGVFQTNIEKVIVAGGDRSGQSLVVWAMQEGKLAAREVKNT